MSRTVPKNDWHPASWQGFAASQQASYPDKAALDRAVADLSRLPPITTSWEVDALKEQIAKAQRGEVTRQSILAMCRHDDEYQCGRREQG